MTINLYKGMYFPLSICLLSTPASTAVPIADDTDYCSVQSSGWADKNSFKSGIRPCSTDRSQHWIEQFDHQNDRISSGRNHRCALTLRSIEDIGTTSRNIIGTRIRKDDGQTSWALATQKNILFEKGDALPFMTSAVRIADS